MSRPCEPEAIFELVEGELDAGREREVLAHLADCPGCRGSYERELSLNASLTALRSASLPCRSVCGPVAMALPTRPLKARLLYSTLALALLLVAFFALSLEGSTPAVLAVSAVDLIWGFVSASADLTRVVFSVTGPTLLFALAAGAVLDLCIAAALLLVRSRRVRQA